MKNKLIFFPLLPSYFLAPILGKHLFAWQKCFRISFLGIFAERLF